MRVSPALPSALLLWLAGAFAQPALATEGRQLPPGATLQKPGDFIWAPELAKNDPVLIIVHLPKQQLHVYSGDVCIGSSTISSGRPGRSSPPGVYTILEKQVFHRSTLYQSAPMPYMQRLTWCGVALHAGILPGYPASHGCLRLPHKFSKLLYEYTKYGMPVIVADAPAESPLPVAKITGELKPIEPAPTKLDLKEVAQSLVQRLEPPDQPRLHPKESSQLTKLDLQR